MIKIRSFLYMVVSPYPNIPILPYAEIFDHPPLPYTHRPTVKPRSDFGLFAKKLKNSLGKFRQYRPEIFFIAKRICQSGKKNFDLGTPFFYRVIPW